MYFMYLIYLFNVPTFTKNVSAQKRNKYLKDVLTTSKLINWKYVVLICNIINFLFNKIMYYFQVNADINVLPFCTQFIPMEVILYPKYQSICYHPSILPRHRGASSINWLVWRNFTCNYKLYKQIRQTNTSYEYYSIN